MPELSRILATLARLEEGQKYTHKTLETYSKDFEKHQDLDLERFTAIDKKIDVRHTENTENLSSIKSKIVWGFGYASGFIAAILIILKVVGK